MFVEKLNKKPEGVYIIEEEKLITDGKWEGYLDHDNANRESIAIYTGPNFTGERVNNFFISTPSETPWKTHLKVFSNSGKIYITYESKGDQVEAEDINLVQESILDTRAELDVHKNDYATLDNFGHVKYAVLTANLDTMWSGTNPPYTKTVSVSGILATDTPIIDVVMSGTYATDEARQEAWGYIYRAVTANGSITFYATEKPTVSLPIQIKVVR